MGGRSCFIISGAFEHGVLRRRQAQTLCDEAPLMGKIHPFSKIAVSFEPVMQL